MTKLFLLALIITTVLTLSGCGMTNDQIIAETNKCQDAGMDGRVIYNPFTYDISKVTCFPKEVTNK